MTFEKQRIFLTSFEEGSLAPTAGIFNEPYVNSDGVSCIKKVFKKAGMLPCKVSTIRRFSESATDMHATDKPRNINGRDWSNMSRNRKIYENLCITVGHRNFKFELI